MFKDQGPIKWEQKSSHSQVQTASPRRSRCRYVCGNRHVTPQQLDPYRIQSSPQEQSGDLTLPYVIPLLAESPTDPLQRRQDAKEAPLVISNERRCTHLMVLGVTGAGKNTRVIDPLRASAIADPNHTVISFSLKPYDYGTIEQLCKRHKRRLITVSIANPMRGRYWNPLQTDDQDVAFDFIRRVCESVERKNSSDSPYWQQRVRTAMFGAWSEGLKSLPAIAELYFLPPAQLLNQLDGHSNEYSQSLHSQLQYHEDNANAQTVLSSIQGTLSAILNKATRVTLSKDELNLAKTLRRPVCLHIELCESQLESYRPVAALLARSIVDSLIVAADRAGFRQARPATIFFDDMPSLGGQLLSPERLLTLRSRNIGIIAGVQSLTALKLAYAESSAALAEGFANKIVLPGLAVSDADEISRETGQTTVEYGSSLMQIPLLSGAEVRCPEEVHPEYGVPLTILLGTTAFQAFLRPTWQMPEMTSLKVDPRAGIKQLRRRARSPRKEPESPYSRPPASPHQETLRLDQMSKKDLQRQVAQRQAELAISDASQAARQWWRSMVQPHRSNKRQLRQMVDSIDGLLRYNHTLQEFYESCVHLHCTDLQANCRWQMMDDTRRLDDEQPF
jgi:hypothetical protein